MPILLLNLSCSCQQTVTLTISRKIDYQFSIIILLFSQKVVCTKAPIPVISPSPPLPTPPLDSCVTNANNYNTNMAANNSTLATFIVN